MDAVDDLMITSNLLSVIECCDCDCNCDSYTKHKKAYDFASGEINML